MTCPKCTAENSDAAKFCSQCGAAFTAGVSAAGSSFTVGAVFSDAEVQALLEINQKLVVGGGKQSSVSQNDIDKLFG